MVSAIDAIPDRPVLSIPRRLASNTEEHFTGRVPTRLVGCGDQATSDPRRTIGRPVEMGAITASLPMQQPARRVVLWHEPVVDQEVAMSGRRHAILVRGAP